LLQRYEITDEVEMILEEDGIKLKRLKPTREGWDEAFARMAANGDDALLIDDVFEDEDLDAWK